MEFETQKPTTKTVVFGGLGLIHFDISLTSISLFNVRFHDFTAVSRKVFNIP